MDSNNELGCVESKSSYISLVDVISFKLRLINFVYNIPRASLLNRPSVPAMDLKSNRSGLWRHMSETCRRLRRLCRKRSNNVARHDKTPVKSTLLSRDIIFMSRRSDIMLRLLHI